MFRILKYSALSILTLFLMVMAYSGWLLLLPVTEKNVETRVMNICLAASAARMALGPRHFPTHLQMGACGCAADSTIKKTGAATAGETLESLRKFIVQRLTDGVTSSNIPARKALPRESEAAIERLAKTLESALITCNRS